MSDITIGRLRGGFCVYWVDPSTGRRKRYQLAARTRNEAESEAREKFLRENWTTGELTVAAIWDAYIDHLGQKPTAETMRHTGKAVLSSFGDLRPAQITVQDSRKYLASRKAEGRKLGTIHTELGHLRSALRWALKSGLISRAPHIELPPKPASNVKPMSGEELQRLIDGCSAPHVRLAVILLIATGARVGAILDLTWSRVDFERGVIDLRLPDGVTRKGRAVVPMNRMSRAALQAAYHARLTDHVVEWAGKRVQSIRKGYAAALERSGLGSMSIHQIRHSVAVRMISAGMPIEVVSQFLGHSTVQITHQTYARFMPEHLQDAADILDLSRFSEPRSTSQNR